MKEQLDRLIVERDNLKANNDQLVTIIGVQAAKIDELTDELYRYKLQCTRYEEKIDELSSLVWDRRLKC